MGHDQQVRRGVEDGRRRITHTPLVRDRERDPGRGGTSSRFFEDFSTPC